MLANIFLAESLRRELLRWFSPTRAPVQCSAASGDATDYTKQIAELASVAITACTKLCRGIGDCVSLTARRPVIEIRIAPPSKVRSVSFTEAGNVANSLRIADLVSITLFAEEQLAAEGKVLFDRVAADQRVEVGLVATGLGT